MAQIEPSQSAFSLLITRKGGVTVKLWGQLDGHATARLRQALTSLIDMGCRQVVVDMGQLSFLGSAGLGPLVGAFKELRSRGGDLVIHAPNRAAYRTLEEAGLSETFTITGRHEDLSPREIEVLSLVIRALHNREIAHQLRISESTVRQHLSSILAKLEVTTRTAAAASALRRGLVALPAE
jgi:anti-anti-sigma factor